MELDISYKTHLKKRAKGPGKTVGKNRGSKGSSMPATKVITAKPFSLSLAMQFSYFWAQSSYHVDHNIFIWGSCSALRKMAP